MNLSLSDAERLLNALDQLDEVHTLVATLHPRITNLEVLMATAAEQIAALSTRFDGLAAVTTDIQADFAALLAAMTAERENLTEAGQAAIDEANARADVAAAKLAELDVAVGDADGSDTPDEPELEPTPGG